MAGQFNIKLEPTGIVTAVNGDVKTLVSSGGLSTISDEYKTDAKVSDSMARLIQAKVGLEVAVAVQVMRSTMMAVLKDVAKLPCTLNANDVLPTCGEIPEADRPKGEELAAAIEKAKVVAAHSSTILGLVAINLVKSGHHLQGSAAEGVATRALAAAGVKNEFTSIFGAGKTGLLIGIHHVTHIFDMGMMQKLATEPPAEFISHVHGVVKMRLPATPAQLSPASNAVAAWTALKESARYSKLAAVLEPVKRRLEVLIKAAMANPSAYDANNKANADRLAQVAALEGDVGFLVAVAVAAKVSSDSMSSAKSYVRISNAKPALIENANHLVSSCVVPKGAEKTASVRGILLGLGVLTNADPTPDMFVEQKEELTNEEKMAAARAEEIAQAKHEIKLKKIKREGDEI